MKSFTVYGYRFTEEVLDKILADLRAIPLTGFSYDDTVHAIRHNVSFKDMDSMIGSSRIICRGADSLLQKLKKQGIAQPIYPRAKTWAFIKTKEANNE